MDKFEWKSPARERAVREIDGKLETKNCEKCPDRHMIQTFRDTVDDETKVRFESLFTEVDYNLFKKETENGHGCLWK